MTKSIINLQRTCDACPEQYDAYLDGEQVGYLRLRHGRFTVQCPNVGGDLVYTASPNGDGIFEYEERDGYLRHAVAAIEKWLIERAPPTPTPPDAEYTINGMSASEDEAAMKANDKRVAEEMKRTCAKCGELAFLKWMTCKNEGCPERNP